MVSDTPDWTNNINIVGSTVTLNIAIASSAVTLNVAIQSSAVTLNVNLASSAITLNVNIASSAATLNINLTSSAITLNINFANQTFPDMLAGEFQSVSALHFFNSGTVALTPQTVPTIIAQAFIGPVLKGYIEGISIGVVGILTPYWVYAYIQIGGVTQIYLMQAQGGVTIFKTPLPIPLNSNANLFVVWATTVAGAAATIGTMWGYLL